LNIHTRKIRTSILIILFIVIVVGGLSYLSIDKITNLLIEKSYSSLTTSRDIKKEQIKDFFAERVSDIEVLSKSSDISMLINKLNNYLSIKNNEKSILKDAFAKDIAAPHEEFLQKYIDKYGYKDILLICAENGNVVYSQSNILRLKFNNTLKNSMLHEVWKNVKKLERVVFSDMKPYSYASNEPVMFMGAPVYINGKFKSVLIFQLSDRGLSKIMNFREGYGKTQEDYLVGSDNRKRSDSYLCKVTHGVKGSPRSFISSRCDTRDTKSALEGRTEKRIVMDIYGNRVLSAYSPLKINTDLNWAILSEIDEDEVLILPNKIRDTIILYSAIFIIIIIAIILFIIYKMFKFEKVESLKSKEMNRNLQKINRELEKSEYEVILLNENLEIKVDQEIAKNRQNQEILFQQSKMASMGEMIGNIAHQWRQPLNALSALNVSLSMRYHAGKLSEYDMYKFKNKSNDLIQRMSDTIDDFRNFFYPDKSIETFVVDRAIEEAISFISSAYKINNITLINYTYTDKEIKNHKNELIQVLLNIFNNAKDAIKEFNGGNGVVIVDVIELEESLKITIQDNGGGIKQDIIDRVFEPYFTTKFKADGTGIGLYMSKMIIEESMHGKLKLENTEDGVLATIELKY